MNTPPLFSIVIAAYNCAEWLPEAIESVVEQDIGFEENIQIVIVNDGSTDDTRAVCAAYVEQFPQNIVYIEQENSGVSITKRVGLENASGRYINFLDADDKWSTDACSEAANMLAANDQIPFCATRHTFFGAREGEHPLSYKFAENAVADLRFVWDKPHLSLSNAFIRREVILAEYFDLNLKVSEDFLVVNRILLANPCYGLLKKPVYWYRKRPALNSAIDASVSDVSWYFVPVERCYKRLFDESHAQYGAVLPFIQYAIMYDLQWRIRSRQQHPLDEDQLGQYRSAIVSLLEQIDDPIILTQRNLSREQRLYVLSLKYGMDFDEVVSKLHLMNDYIKWIPDISTPGVDCWLMEREAKLHIDFMKRDGDGIVLEGRLTTVLPQDKLRIFAQVEEEGSRELRIIEASTFTRYDKQTSTRFDEGFFTAIGFKLSLPCGFASFFFEFESRQFKMELDWGSFSRFSPEEYSYTPFGDIAVRPRGTDKIAIEHHDRIWYAKREVLLERSLAKDESTRKFIKYRHEALKHRDSDTQVWLISDRANMAGDNGEALFRYLADHPIPNVTPYFVINDDSDDYERLKQYGRVVARQSEEHKKLHMQASFIISSAAEGYVYNCFGDDEELLWPLERHKFVFLQHGITKDDISGWLNRWKKNIALFITAAKPEYDSIIENAVYGYGPETVKLTGFARHDALVSEASAKQREKSILIAPTWRNSLANDIDQDTGTRPENPFFEESDYYKFYQSLINDERLIAAAKEMQYSINLLIHPAFMQEAQKFSSPLATICTSYDYREQLISSTIMVTDYSSVAFDFALLRKPLIYAQFDLDSFYGGHTYAKGYFDYKRDGFGEICMDKDAVVESLIKLMERPEMPDEYRRRADGFFYEPPKGSSRCKEIIDAILAL